MASQEGCVTLKWEFRKFSALLKVKEKGYLISPHWEVEDTKGREVRGTLIASCYDPQINFLVNGFENHVRCEMSFTSSCGVVQLKADSSDGKKFVLPKSVLFDKNRQSILLNDTMTLCCRTWGKTLRTSELHIATVFLSLNHLWTIEKLASSDYHDTYFAQENVKFHFSLENDGNDDFWMGIVKVKQCALFDLFIVECEVSVKDGCGRFLCHQNSYWYKDSSKFFLFPIDSNITSVTLQLNTTVALYGRHEFQASSQAVRGTQLKPNFPTNIAKHKNVSGALGDDLLLLYRESAFSDLTLNTEGKSFSAHRTILAARSQVFRAMFEKDERSEGQSGVVDIDDVDSETVDRMLVYLYADSVGDLEWKEASALYYAADKYAIMPLKEKCADILKAGLAADNACDAHAWQTGTLTRN